MKAELCAIEFVPGFGSCEDGMLSELQRCVIKCRLDADCGELENRDLRPETFECESDCGASLFVCDDGSRIPEDWRCDEIQDCRDNSDEMSCTDSGTSTFVCDDGTIIPVDWRCDGRLDCPDDSDEAGCSGAGAGGASGGGGTGGGGTGGGGTGGRATGGGGPGAGATDGG